MTTQALPQFLSVRDVAERLGLGTTTVYGLVAAGELAKVRLPGRRIVIPSWAVEQLWRGMPADRLLVGPSSTSTQAEGDSWASSSSPDHLTQ